MLFAYLTGYLPESKKKELALPDEGLVNATLTISLSVVYADGSHDNEKSYTVPLKTTSKITPTLLSAIPVDSRSIICPVATTVLF